MQRRHHPHRHRLALATLALVAATAAQAQAQIQLERVEVVGTSPVAGTEVPRDHLAAPVQTARAADLERSQAADLSNFMNRRLGGVHLNEVQGNPLQPDVNYRGFTASPLLGSAQGLSVYLDGLRLNQPFGDVVSWDLIPKAAIDSLALMPGSNPLFGLNTLGGALNVQTKTGFSHVGNTAQVQAGSFGRRSAEFEHGGHTGTEAEGTHAYLTGQTWREDGWRVASPSQAHQLFGKLGRRSGDTELTLTAALADTRLNGNGLQEGRFLARDRHSVYTQPDTTENRAGLLSLGFSQALNEQWRLTGQVYTRHIRTRTLNGDLNEGSLDQSLYQPNASERAALTAAGYRGFPNAGESAANTPFPKWRCIAQALLNDEPAEKCNGVINHTRTTQRNAGFSAQLNHDGRLLGRPAHSLLGVALDVSHSHFTQGSELGYLSPDRSVTGVGAVGDGVHGGNVDGEPYDTRVDLSGRSRTLSAFASSVLALSPGTHLTVAGRYNHTHVRNRDAITPGGGPGSLDGDHSFRRLNPALGLTFTLADGVNAWLGVNQGSRTPSSIELGCADPAHPCKLPNAMAGDPPLKQVVSTTLEAGLRSTAGRALAWNLGVFRTDNRDDLLFVADDAAGFGYFKNFGRTRRQGVELGLSSQPARGLTAGVQATWLDATYRTAETLNGAANSSNDTAQAGLPGVDGTLQIQPGDRLPLLPRRLLKLSLDLDLSPHWSLGADAQAVSGALARGNENGQHRPDGVYYLGPGRSAGYAVVNLHAAWTPTPNFKLFAHVNNLIDRDYATAAQLGPTGFNDAGQFQSRPFPVNTQGERPLRHSTFFAPGAPRSVGVGAKLTF